MVIEYNWYNLEPKFKNWLVAGNLKTRKRVLAPVSVKNYLSDLRHFLGWLIFKFKVQNSKFEVKDDFPIEALSQITPQIIQDYKSYLIENKIPVKTTNRRLSSLRKFFSFCIDQGWIKENPAKKVINVTRHPEFISGSNKMLKQVQHDIITQFHQDLLKENLDQKTIKSYLDDIREFLSL